MFRALSHVDPSDTASLREALEAHLINVERDPPGDRALVSRVETDVQQDPAACIAFDQDAHATLRAANRVFHAGRFETPAIRDLRTRAERLRLPSGRPPPRLRLHVMDGASAATDIGALQAVAPHDSLFQVASQFNCLEAPDSFVVPVSDYFHDPTQGPRASISAFPGTLLRHYAAPAANGARFVQRDDGPQINLLEAVCSTEVAVVRSGYLTIASIARPDVFARALDERFDDIRVGVHDAIEVVFGYNWLGPVPAAPQHRIAQVFTSTLAAGGYGQVKPSDGAALSIIRQLQRAAYAGTLLAAASLGKSYAVLTMIGGGVFGNPHPVIWESILWAVDFIRPLLHKDLCVIVNGYSLGRQIPPRQLYEAAVARGGTMAVFDAHSVRVGAP
jgi:hypothetical protein